MFGFGAMIISLSLALLITLITIIAIYAICILIFENAKDNVEKSLSAKKMVTNKREKEFSVMKRKIPKPRKTVLVKDTDFFYLETFRFSS